MKNKYISYFINSFAAIGFFVVACSVADSSPADTPDDSPPIVQSNIGKYQVSVGDEFNFNVINTETGQVKIYYLSGNSIGNNPEWSLAGTINTQ